MKTLEERNQEVINQTVFETEIRQSAGMDVEMYKYYDKIVKDQEQGNMLQEPFKRVFKYGRNQPCPCGSGKKFKKCCLDKLK